MTFAFRASVVARAADGRIVIALFGEKPTDIRIALCWPDAALALSSALRDEAEQRDAQRPDDREFPE